MRSEYDFSGAKRARDVPHLAKLQAAANKGKTRITIFLDSDIIQTFRARAESEGRGYQTAINDALRAAVAGDAAPATVGDVKREVRRALREVKREHATQTRR